jgi:uncharacterized protein (TIGR03435 family)
MRRRLAGIGLLLLLSTAALAQEAEAPRFDVVSVKRNVTGTTVSTLRPETNGITGINIAPMRLIAVAYQAQRFQVAEAPGWLTSERYDVTARAARPVTRAELAPMIRALLADRFGLRIVQRRRDSAVLELQVEQTRAAAEPDRPAGGPGLKRSERACSMASSPDAPVTRGPGTPACFTSAAGSLIARGVTLDMVARELTGELEQFVVDRSGLAGTFDFELHWAPDTGGAPPAPGAGVSDLPPLVTAVREQLGLRLVPARAAVDVFVVEAASRPTPD